MMYILLLTILVTFDKYGSAGFPIGTNARLSEDGDYVGDYGRMVCKQHDCPKYTIMNKTKQFEVRLYPAYKYVVAYEEGNDSF